MVFMPTNWIITTGGEAALAAAHLAGTDFELDKVAFGQGQYTPTGSETAILNPFSPVREFSNPAGFRDGNKITAIFSEPNLDGYDVGEAGIFSGSVLYAIASDPTDLLFSKPAGVPYQFAAYFVASGDSVTSVTFASAPAVIAASETALGLVQIATQIEVDARVDDRKVVTPATLPPPSAVPNASTTQRGSVELANQTEANALSDDDRALTPGPGATSVYKPTWSR